jgi:hypothetical protein
MVNKKSVLKCQFRDYLNPDEAKKEPKPTKPIDFNYGNKLKFKEKNND